MNAVWCGSFGVSAGQPLPVHARLRSHRGPRRWCLSPRRAGRRCGGLARGSGRGPNAVLIGHDWGAEAAYGAAAFAPDRWRRLVTLAIPPAALDEVLFNDYEQLKRFFYLFMFRDPAGLAEAVVARDDLAFLDELWRDWSPGFQPGEHLARVKACLRQPANLAAALGYYRAAADQEAAGRQAPQPTLYLHGTRDGCIGRDLVRDAERLLAPPARMIVIDDAGHFLHLEEPGQVNDHILSWVS